MSARQPYVSGARPTSPACVGEHTPFVITCEHGGNRVPAPYRSLFASGEALLRSHRGYDPGALLMARDLARALDAPLILATTSRLLIDLNRSVGHRELYSDTLRAASREIRETLYKRYYVPYRRRVERQIAAALEAGAGVVHISSHSFTPMLHGVVRDADVGLLYDPARPAERELCRRWLSALRARAPQLRLRRNYPYAGRADGLCTWMRRHYPSPDYVGIELEVNQRHVSSGGRAWRRLRADVITALLQARGCNPVHLKPPQFGSGGRVLRA